LKIQHADRNVLATEREFQWNEAEESEFRVLPPSL